MIRGRRWRGVNTRFIIFPVIFSSETRDVLRRDPLRFCENMQQMASLSPDSTNCGADPGQMFVTRDPELFLGRVFADALGAMTLFFCVISSPLASDRCLFFLCHCLQTWPRLLNLSQLFSPLFFFYLLCCVGAGGSPAARTPTPELRENLESSHAFFFFFFSF